MWMKRGRVACLTAAVMLSTTAAGQLRAQEEATEPESDAATSSADSAAPATPLEDRFVHTSHLQIRVNPIGLSHVSDTAYRIHLFDSDSILLQGTRLDLGITTRINPAFLWGGPYFEITPVAILKLRAELTPLLYFGNYGFVFEFADRNDDWSPERLDALEEQDAGESVTGLRVLGSATLQAKVGPVAALYENRLTWYSMDVERPYYEAYEFFLFEPDDTVWTMSGTLGYVFGADPTEWFLLVGGRYDRHVTLESDFSRQLLGGILLWKVPNAWVSFTDLRVATIVQTYLEDPYTEGEPYFAMQVSFIF